MIWEKRDFFENMNVGVLKYKMHMDGDRKIAGNFLFVGTK